MEYFTWSLAGVISSCGLILDIIGVILLFRYGLPPEGVSRTGAILIAWGNNPEGREKGKRYDRLSYVALGCLVVGFLVQIVSNFLE